VKWTYCNTLQHTATHCIITLQHTATHCNTLQHTATHYIITLEHTRTHWNTLQHTAQNTLKHPDIKNKKNLGEDRLVAGCSMRCTATHCNTPQHTATHCNTTNGTTLKHTARHCIQKKNAGGWGQNYSGLRTATHCTHCSTLQHNTRRHPVTCCNNHTPLRG